MTQNRGIMHLATAPGGRPFCRARGSHMSTTLEGALKWPRICMRCQRKLSVVSRARFAIAHAAAFKAEAVSEEERPAAEWSGEPDPADPDNFWIDDVTGERVCAHTGARSAAA